MLYIYDARYNLKLPTTYEKVSEMVGSSINTLRSLKSRKLKIPRLDYCYLIDENTPKQQLREWYEKVVFENEVWKDIDDTCKISNYGRFKKIYKTYPDGKFAMPFTKLKRTKTKLYVKLHGKDCFVHQLVAKYFVENKFNYTNVYHKNGILHDNYHMNLAYISKEELGKLTGGKANKRGSIIAIDIDTNEIVGHFRSSRAVEKELFVSRQSVNDCLNGKTKVVGGKYKFIYEED